MRDGYVLLKELHRAGVYLIVVDGDRLQWRCDPTRPPAHGDMYLELKDHRADIIRILLDVPAGCRVPGVCNRIGICPREIAARACTLTVPEAASDRREAAA